VRRTTRLKQAITKRLPFLEGVQRRLYKLKPYRRKFRSYYLDGGWGPRRESRSGPGSSLEKTAAIRAALPKIFATYRVATFVDVPCGDFHWMRLVDLRGRHYIGIDIVPELVAENIRQHAAPGIEFRYGDLLVSPPPRADLILCRDLLGHYRNRDVLRALDALRASGSRYLLTTTYPQLDTNTDLDAIGLFRLFNLQLPPFNLPPPIELISEDEPGKALGLWDLRRLQAGR
jgi:hypothetical protein